MKTIAAGNDSERGIWTGAQRRGLAVGIILVAGALAIVAIRNPLYIPDPVTGDGPRASLLEDKLDPNTATAAELAAIPNLGEKRAGAIVAFRQQRLQAHPDRAPFNSIDELGEIKGIGPGTLALLRAHLKIVPPGRAGG